MRKTLLILFFLISTFLNCLSFNYSDSSIKHFPVVNVISTKITNNPTYNFYPISIIDSNIICNKGNWQISELLNISPGIFIKDYGGLGGLKTLSLRGTTASQTLILLDGIKLNSIQNGIVDLSTIPTELIKEIEISRSGSSAFFGGNAVAGCINILTQDKIIDKFNFKTNLKYGSYNDFLTNLNLSFPLGNFGINTTIEFINSSGKYPFLVDNYGLEQEFVRQNADFSNLVVSLSEKIMQNEWLEYSRLILRWTNRGAPGAVVQGKIENSFARLNEKEALFINSFKHIIDDESSFAFDLNLKYNELKYSDSSFIVPKEDNYYNSEFNFNANYNFVIIGIMTKLTLETNICLLTGDNLKSLNTGKADRINLGASLLFTIPLKNDDWLFKFLGTSRLDYFSDWKFFATFSGGIYIENMNFPLSFRFQASNNYRMPSFNELYYFNYGSTNLVPEESVSLNLGFSTRLFSLINLNLDGFYINNTNQIVSVPKSPINWNAENIGKAITKGIELSSNLIIFDSLLQLSLSYTLQKASDESDNSLTKGKLIPYIPQELLSGFAFFNLSPLSFAIFGEYTGFRFALSDNLENSLLPEVMIIDLTSNYFFNISKMKLIFSFNIKNLFNTRYSVIINYPMPGRIIRFGIAMEI